MNLYQLSNESLEVPVTDEEVATLEVDTPEEEVHPAIPDSIEDDDQISLLTKTMNTIDSLESLACTLMTAKDLNMELSQADLSVLSHRISMAYATNGLKEPEVFHLSRESVSAQFDDTVALSLEGVLGRVGDLAKTAAKKLGQIKKKTTDFLSSNESIVKRCGEEARKLLSEIESADWKDTKADLKQKTLSFVTHGKKINIAKSMDVIIGINDNHFNDKRMVTDYLDQLTTYLNKVSSLSADVLLDKEKYRQARVNICKSVFKVNVPFRPAKTEGEKHVLHLGSHSGQDVYVAGIGDGLIVKAFAPNGESRMVPSFTLYDKPINVYGKEVNFQALSKQEAITSLKAIIKAVDSFKDWDDFIVGWVDIDKKVKELRNENSELMKRIRKTLSNQKELTATSITVGAVMSIFMGPIAMFAGLGGLIRGTIEDRRLSKMETALYLYYANSCSNILAANRMGIVAALDVVKESQKANQQ